MTQVNVKMDLCCAASVQECDDDWAEDMAQLFIAETDTRLDIAMDEALCLCAQLKDIDCGFGIDYIRKNVVDDGVQFVFSNEGEEFCETPVLRTDSRLAEALEALMGERLPAGGNEPKW